MKVSIRYIQKSKPERMRLPQVDDYIREKCQDFSRPICTQLREIYLEQGLIEEFKWSAPCYSHQGLVCSLGAFKKHVGSWFFKGALLHDPKQILRKAQKDTKGLRSLYYTDAAQIDPIVVREFVQQAMILNEQNISIPQEKGKTAEPSAPAYMLEMIAKDPRALAVYEEFSPYKRKEYIEWICSAKREDTRQRRLLQMMELLRAGKGLMDRYRK